jgi:hypothetical protein
MFQRRRARPTTAAIAISAVVAAGCGSSSTTTVTAPSSTTAPAPTTTTTSGGASGAGTSGAGNGGNPLTGINPPAGSVKLGMSVGDGVVYQHYSTSSSPSQVVSHYNQQLTGAGWTIVQKGGSGGGWGPYGGSSSGLTAKKREDEYFNVQAGGQSGHKSYFEVCATSGHGSRAGCDKFSDQANHHTQSGGSQSGSSTNNNTNSGGS